MKTLQFLSEGDRQALFEKAERLKFPKGAVILEAGSDRRSLFFVHLGVVRVEGSRSGRGIGIAQLGPGDFFGEMALLEQSVASATIVAESDVELDCVSEAHVQALLASVPGLAARFYQSLSVELARRIRATSKRLTELNVGDVAQVNRFHTPRTGNIGERQIPEQLSVRLSAARKTLDTIAEEIRSRRCSDADASRRVTGACEQIVAVLTDFTQDQSLLEIGWSDLLSFRDSDQIEEGLGAWVFRETFPVFMAGTTMARCYMKPRGYPDDVETMALLCAQEGEGDGWLGGFIDSWFLGRPLAASRRAARAWLSTWLARLIPGSGSVTSLASGLSAELFDASVKNPGLLVTCVDIDTAPLARGRARAESLGIESRWSFARGNVLSIADRQSPFSLAPQDAIYALDLCDYLDDTQIVAVLDWIWEHLAANGEAVITNLLTGHPDHGLMTHILEWQTVTRTEEQISRIFGQTRFGAPEITAEGTIVLARAKKL